MNTRTREARVRGGPTARGFRAVYGGRSRPLPRRQSQQREEPARGGARGDARSHDVNINL